MTFVKILSAEWLKTKRTPMRWIAFLVPIIFSIFFLGYFSLKKITPTIQIFIFGIFFECWTTIIIPIVVGLISGFIIYEEELAGSFNGFLVSKSSHSSLYLGKLIMLIMLTSVSIIIATLVLVVGLVFFMNIKVSWMIFIRAAVLTEVGTIPLLALNLWLSLAFGMGVSIGFGGAGIVISALVAIIGDKVWQFVIWAWPERLSVMQMFYLPGESIKNHSYIFNETIKGIILVTLSFIVILVLGLIWFNNWEGRKSYD